MKINDEIIPLINNKETLFPATNKYIYLGVANVAPPLINSTNKSIEWHNDILSNGSVNFNDKSEERAFIPLRQEVSKLFKCHIDEISCGSSATELLSSVAWAIYPKSGENIVSCSASFPSTVYPWHRISMHSGCEVRLAQHNQDNFYTSIDSIISLIDKNTKVVTVSHIEYTCGQIYDLKKLAEITHNNGALLVVDATQSAGSIPIYVKECGVDVLVSASYKWLCSTFGCAVMYMNKSLAKELVPGLFGFRSHKNMWDCSASRIELKETADKFEFSTMHFGSAIALTESIKYINELGIENIHNYNISLARYFVEKLKAFKNCKIITPLNDKEFSSIITIKLNDIPTEYIVSSLKKDKIIVTNRSNFIRISIHFYNTIEDLNVFIFYLKKIIRTYLFKHKSSKL